MIREKRWFGVFYMFVVTAFFSTIVIGFSRFTRTRVEANKAMAFEHAVLAVLPSLFDAGADSIELHRRFAEQVGAPDASSAGAYTFEENGRVAAYALPISGQGFWAPIKSVIGIDADRKTITAIVFYEQNETPGLGAQITTTEFRKQFEGKLVSSGAMPLNFKRAGEPLGESDVHAVTGATQTSIRLEKLINAALVKWRTELGERAGEK